MSILIHVPDHAQKKDTTKNQSVSLELIKDAAACIQMFSKFCNAAIIRFGWGYLGFTTILASQRCLQELSHAWLLEVPLYSIPTRSLLEIDHIYK